jgi:hypothetical protein
MGLVLVVGCESLERMAPEAAPVGKGLGTLVSVMTFPFVHSFTRATFRLHVHVLNKTDIN